VTLLDRGFDCSNELPTQQSTTTITFLHMEGVPHYSLFYSTRAFHFSSIVATN
jgi:hypothetical protein